MRVNLKLTVFTILLFGAKYCLCKNGKEEAKQKLEILFQKYFEWQLETSPSEAVNLGIHEYDEDIEDMSVEGLDKILEKCHHFKDISSHLLNNKSFVLHLDFKDQLYLKILHRQVEECVHFSGHRGFLLAQGSSLYGLQTTLTNSFGKDTHFKLESFQDYQKLLRRLRKVPTQLERVVELLKQGVKEGITYSNESMWRVKSQFDRLQAHTTEDSDFYYQFKYMEENSNINTESSAILGIQNEAKEVIESEVLPSFSNMAVYIEEEYMQHLRPSPGISVLPGGREMYLGYLRYHTTESGWTPEEIHQIGLTEVEDLTVKMKQVAQNLGYFNLTQKEFFQKIRNEKSQLFSSKNEILEFFRNLAEKNLSKLAKYFGPKVARPEVLAMDVKVAALGGALAYYIPSSLNGKRRGSFNIDLGNVATWKKFDSMALALHEGNPGHNLQITYSTLNEAPNFLKVTSAMWSLPSCPSTYSAFVEGWALYSEYLGLELGLYEEDPYQLVGFYSFNLLRASRLVVDTGMHALNWTRKQAVDYLLENSALSYQHVESEIDRYITWPGQAVAYKIGERNIKKLREKLEHPSNVAFDLKEFHMAVLDCYGPLDYLEECVLSKTGFGQLFENSTNKRPRSTATNSEYSNTNNLMLSLCSLLALYFVV